MRHKNQVNPLAVLLLILLFGNPIAGAAFAIFLYTHGEPALDCIAVAAMPVAMNCIFLYFLNRQDKYNRNHETSKEILGMTKSVSGTSVADMFKFMQENKSWIHADLRGYTTGYEPNAPDEPKQTAD